MAYQLIYTSYPTSLTVGRSGFSTVSRNSELSEKLAALVEKCGTYEPDSFKGVVYSHRKIFFGGKVWHILTRACSTSADYTGRSNYIAHHLIIDSAEIASLTNPADILFGWKGWLSEWKSDPKWIEGETILKVIPALTILPARHWKEATGDSGSAALLGNSPSVVVAETGKPERILMLFSESLKLNVKQPDSWDITFTTHFFYGDNGSDFLWRAVDTDSPESASARIDFVKKIFPQVPETRAVTYARTGELNNRERLNLKVDRPPVSNSMQFRVSHDAGVEDTGIVKKKIAFFLTGMVCLIALCFVFINTLYFSDNDEPESDFAPVPTKLGKANQIPSVGLESAANAELNGNYAKPIQVAGATPMEVIRARIDAALESENFEDAVKIWNDSGFSENDPMYEKRLLSRIGMHIDSIMNSAERIITGEALTSPDKSNVLKSLIRCISAMDNLDIPRRAERSIRTQSIMKKIVK